MAFTRSSQTGSSVLLSRDCSTAFPRADPTPSRTPFSAIAGTVCSLTRASPDRSGSLSLWAAPSAARHSEVGPCFSRCRVALANGTYVVAPAAPSGESSLASFLNSQRVQLAYPQTLPTLHVPRFAPSSCITILLSEITLPSFLGDLLRPCRVQTRWDQKSGVPGLPKPGQWNRPLYPRALNAVCNDPKPLLVSPGDSSTLTSHTFSLLRLLALS